ncbi:MAG: hypothetical protein JW993_03780 [Sedimentisphaerales bacterium]|nr:hypothetical protein [Sedimentisphaerales bacterium]
MTAEIRTGWQWAAQVRGLCEIVTGWETTNMRLESKRVIETIDRLTLRIRDRFPTSDLYEVCRHLYGIAKRTEQTAVRIARPVWALRLSIVALVVAFLVAIGAILCNYDTEERITLFGLVQAIEAGSNLLILIALGAAFLWSIETRIKRSRAISAINELRDIAHVIDMKQLTKDPDGVGSQARPTTHSPKRDLDAHALGRYLDYCTEMLSLTSKMGYLYVENFHDTEVTNAATELENLCSGLARKIWQKIVILQTQTPAS